ANIPFGPLGVFRRGRLAQLVARRKRAILRQSPARTPTVVCDAVIDREIERRAVRARLAARNDYDRAQIWQPHKREASPTPIAVYNSTLDRRPGRLPQDRSIAMAPIPAECRSGTPLRALP